MDALTPALALAEIPPSDERDAAALLQVDSVALLQGHRELLICHGDQVYRLRHTQSDKLILTK